MGSDSGDDDGDAFVGGVVLIAGATDYENTAKRPSKGKKPSSSSSPLSREETYPDLLSPHRFSALNTIRISFIAAGCAASHAVAVDVAGVPFVWGRNLEGQLGLGDAVMRSQPVPIPRVTSVVSASCGRAHTAFVTKTGTVLTTGDNKFGQLGNNSNIAQVDEVVAMSLSKAVKKVACGADFTLILSREGVLYSCGSGEKGALGDGSTHVFNSKVHSIKMEIQAQPRPRPVPALGTVTNMAAGVNHAAAITDTGAVYTWGCGDYGRLGHGVQKDELRPRRLDLFTGQRSSPPDAFLACGASTTLLAGDKGTYWWGKAKVSGDAMMTPTLCDDLRGWKVRSLSAGKGTFGVSAESSCILWGQATHGELAGGQHASKTSARATKCIPMEGLLTQQVACANGFTIMLVDDRHSPKRIESFALYEAPEKDPLSIPAPAPSKATASKKKTVATKRKRNQ